VPFVEVPGIDVGSVPDGRGERAGIAFDGFIEKRQAVRIAPIDPALGHDPVQEVMTVPETGS